MPSDKAQNVAKILRDRNVGSLPVVTDQQAHKLVGMITDRDLCCTIIADGLDPRNTTIEKFISVGPVTCRDGENVEKCERAMQEHQLRRIPVVDAEGNCIGIVSQADLLPVQFGRDPLNFGPIRFAMSRRLSGSFENNVGRVSAEVTHAANKFGFYLGRLHSESFHL